MAVLIRLIGFSMAICRQGVHKIAERIRAHPIVLPCLPTNEHQRQPRAWRVRDQQIPSDCSIHDNRLQMASIAILGRKQVARPKVVAESAQMRGAPCRRTHMISTRMCDS